MDINQLLSTPAATLLSPSKLSYLQCNTTNGLERPVIIPLGGSGNISNPLGMVPMPLLNQQFLVPLAAFQTAKESVSSLPTTSSVSSSHSSVTTSQPVICTQPLGATFGMNLSTSKDSNSFPLILDSNQASIISPISLSQTQPKSTVNQNVSVQYATQLITEEKQKITDIAIKQEVNLESTQKMSPKLPRSLLDSDVKSCSYSTSTLSNDSLEEKNNQDSEKSKSSCNDAEGKVDVESLSRIISSLPPGWKVVGLTNLTGADGAQPTPVLETHNIRSHASTSCDNSTIYSSNSYHRCGIPDVVSVDLNNPTNLSLTDGVLNEDSFPDSKIGSTTLPTSFTDSSNIKIQTSIPSPRPLITPSNPGHNITMDSDQFPVKIKKEVDTMGSQISSQQKLDLDMTKSEWRVVGLTSTAVSLPQTSVSDAGQQVSNVPLPFPLLISSEPGGLNEERQSNSRSPKATILNVPSPKLIQQSVKISSQQKSSTSLDVIKSSSEEMKWTIVGVTVATTISTTSLFDNDSGKDSVSTARMSNGSSDDTAVADCVVTNSQQRPVSSSVSKNAPLPSEIKSKGIDSVLKDQWKVVGVTQSINENQTSQIPPIKYQLPVPLLFQQQQQQQQPPPPPPPPPPPTLLVTSVNSLTTNTSTNLNSNNLMTSLPCLSSTGLLQNSLAGTLNNSMSWITPPLLPLPSSQSNSLLEQQQLLHLLQNQLQLQHHQQQEHRQMIVNHIQSQLAIQNQLPFMNTLNEWNLVGLLSNIPSTLIKAGSQPETVSPSSSDLNDIETNSSPVEIDQVSEPVISDEQFSTNVCQVKKDDCNPNSEAKQSKQNKSKDLAAKYTKKNTVSHLLKLKRMKMKEDGEDGPHSHSDQEGYEVVMSMKHNKGEIAFLTRADKGIRSRPLHSYAGNRKIFSKTVTLKREPRKEKISLRSGNLVPVQNLNLDKESNEIEVKTEPSTDTTGYQEMRSESSPLNENRSAARKRKLKIPRKMIADVDYQPFDSSSDSC